MFHSSLYKAILSSIRLKVYGVNSRLVPIHHSLQSAGREATTIGAGISASGDKLPQFILFKGKKFCSSWKGSKSYPGTQYAFSDSGWMVAEAFIAWFDFFSKTVYFTKTISSCL